MAGAGGSARTNPERRGAPEPSCGDSFLKPHFKTQPRAPPGLLLRAGPAAGNRKAINAAQSLALGTASPSIHAIRLRRGAPGRTRSSPAAHFSPAHRTVPGGGGCRRSRSAPTRPAKARFINPRAHRRSPLGSAKRVSEDMDASTPCAGGTEQGSAGAAGPWNTKGFGNKINKSRRVIGSRARDVRGNTTQNKPNYEVLFFFCSPGPMTAMSGDRQRGRALMSLKLPETTMSPLKCKQSSGSSC